MSKPLTVTHVVLGHWRADVSGADLTRMREMTHRFQAETHGIVSVVEGASVSPEGLDA